MMDATERLAAIAAIDGPAWPLGEAGLLLALLDNPGVDLARYDQHLATLGILLAETGAESARARADALATVLHVDHGYRGDSETYDDMVNADLMAVIDRGCGLPVALAILYIEAARRAGWRAWGLNVPGHFVIRVEGEADWEVVDPFHGGVPVEAGTLQQLIKTYVGPDAALEPHHTAPMADRDILLRLLNNIRGRALQAEDADRGLEIMDRMLLIAPKEAGLWLESAAIRIKLGQLMGAREAVTRCMELDADGSLHGQAERLLRSLRRDLN